MPPCSPGAAPWAGWRWPPRRAAAGPVGGDDKKPSGNRAAVASTVFFSGAYRLLTAATSCFYCSQMAAGAWIHTKSSTVAEKASIPVPFLLAWDMMLITQWLSNMSLDLRPSHECFRWTHIKYLVRYQPKKSYYFKPNAQFLTWTIKSVHSAAELLPFKK